MPRESELVRDKQRLRAWARERRQNLSAEQVAASSEAISTRLMDLLPPGSLLGVYAAVRGEVGICADLLLARGYRLAWPRSIRQDFSLHFVEASEEPRTAGAYGIPEPPEGETVPAAHFDAIILPGVAFTLAGDRLGQGAGFYDRFLDLLRVDALRVGIGYMWQVVDSLPTEAHDARLTHVVTETQTITTGYNPGEERK